MRHDDSLHIKVVSDIWFYTVFQILSADITFLTP